MTEDKKLTLEDWEKRFSLKGDHLYFNDKLVQTGIKLNRAQFFWAVLAAIATVVNAAANAWNVFFKNPPAPSPKTSPSSNQPPAAVAPPADQH